MCRSVSRPKACLILQWSNGTPQKLPGARDAKVATYNVTTNKEKWSLEKSDSKFLVIARYAKRSHKTKFRNIFRVRNFLKGFPTTFLPIYFLRNVVVRVIVSINRGDDVTFRLN